MLGVLKITVSMRQFFLAHMLKLMGKKIFTILSSKFCLSKPMGLTQPKYGRCSKILNTSCLPKRPQQTAPTQIRQLLKKQFNQGLPYLPFKRAFLKFQL